ncbi:reverse transcriptase from mobile element jockey [Pyrrhoderma noxium]|uniref:Reverse transcriptase from mobile element jockey n=1 Tax=Pyrrhoderma noxium TaxID=2282107 RepID=A0A286UPY5_9AGAM|nr:reverse transcriptase from mobile element jockey [Pyrrhoderma noxium]
MLSFTPHVKRMATKAKSTLAALSIVGNTVQGLSPTFMRQLYIGVVLPVLLWGAEIWCRGPGKKPQRALRNLLKPVYHQGIRFTLGAYKSSPIPPMTLIAGILPFDQLLNLRITNACIRTLTTPLRPDPIPHWRRRSKNPPAYEEIRNSLPKQAECIPPLLPFPPEERAQCKQEFERASHQLHLILFAAAWSPPFNSRDPAQSGAAWTAYKGPHKYMDYPIPLPPKQDNTACILHAINDLVLNLRAGRLHLALPQNHQHVLIACDHQEALDLINSPKLKPGFELAWQVRTNLTECALAHPDLHIRLVWGRGFEHLPTSSDTLDLARHCADTPSTLNKPPTLRYLKAEAKLKAGTAWRQLLQRYYNEHPHSSATRATARWQPHPTSNLLKKLGRNPNHSGQGTFPRIPVGHQRHKCGHQVPLRGHRDPNTHPR